MADGDRTEHIIRGGGRPRYGYKLTVPSVTTITGLLNKPALVGWAWRLGREGRDHEEARNAAANAGTIAHQAIEEHIHGGNPARVLSDEREPEEQRDKAARAFARFLGWEAEYQPEYIATELPLVSWNHRFGGTVDLVCRIGGVLHICDHKTGRGPYAEQLVQLAAYAHLMAEARETPERVALLLLGDDTRKLHNSYAFAELGPPWREFLALLDAYHEQRAVEALVGAR